LEERDIWVDSFNKILGIPVNDPKFQPKFSTPAITQKVQTQSENKFEVAAEQRSKLSFSDQSGALVEPSRERMLTNTTNNNNPVSDSEVKGLRPHQMRIKESMGGMEPSKRAQSQVPDGQDRLIPRS
jgi:hypothetical protein